MLNLCRSFMEPCPCARSRFGWQMSNTAKMPETCNPPEKPNPCIYLNNYREMPIHICRSCGGQRIGRPSAGQDYPREYKKHKTHQSYPEQLPEEFQDYESYGSQHSYCHSWEPCRERYEPELPHKYRRCYEEQTPPPRRYCCEQQSPPPPQRCCCQGNPRSNCQEKVASECREKKRRRRSCRRRKCSCDSFCVVTHEISVQTEPPPKPDHIEIIDITTQEKEVRHRDGQVEVLVDEIQTVTVVPNDGSKPTKSQVQSYTSSDAPKQVRKQFHEEIDPNAIEVPDKALRYSVLEPMMKNLNDIPSNPSSGYTSPSEVKERRVYRTNEKYEKENEYKIGSQETHTFLDDPDENSQRVKRHVAKPTIAVALSQSMPPSSNQESSDSPVSRYKTKKNLKHEFEKQTAKSKSSRMVKNSEGKLVPKPRASDFGQVSTVHMKVTNRRERLSQKAGRKSVHQDAVFETKISELRLLSPDSEEEEPEPPPKPKRKKPKKVPKPTCPPPNDLVCRMHRPIQRQKCDPQMCRAGCGAGCGPGGRSCNLPCIVPCSGSPYPPCVPRKKRCDPIYGFGSQPAAYYCHR